MCINASCIYNAANSHYLSNEPDSEIVQYSAYIILEKEEAPNVVRIESEVEIQILYSRRFGRAIRLPTRFR